MKWRESVQFGRLVGNLHQPFEVTRPQHHRFGIGARLVDQRLSLEEHNQPPLGGGSPELTPPLSQFPEDDLRRRKIIQIVHGSAGIRSYSSASERGSIAEFRKNHPIYQRETRSGLQWSVVCAVTRSVRSKTFTNTMPAINPPRCAQNATPPPSGFTMLVNPPNNCSTTQ